MNNTMDDRIDQQIKRTRAYWFNDGLAELMLGALFLFIALFQYVQEIAPRPMRLALAIAFPLILLFGIFLTRRAMTALKDRLTHPRTGYVSYQRPPSRARRWLVVLVTAVLGAAFGWAVATLFNARPEAANYMPLAQGVFLGLILSYVAYHGGGVTRLYVIAAFAILLGVFQALALADHPLGYALFNGLFGLSLALSGGLTLRNYLRRTASREER